MTATPPAVPLRTYVERVAEARRSYAALKVVQDQRLRDFATRHADDIQRLKLLKEAVDLAETSLRIAGEADYKVHANKKPAPGVGVKIMPLHALTYDADKALAWATEKQMCLRLDTTAFEAVAPSLKLPFVTESSKEEVVVTIAKDLDAALAAATLTPEEQTV